MKKFLSMLTVLLVCVTLVTPAFAAGTFVPSISYKDGPMIVSAVMNSENVEDCLIVTSVAAAKNKTTDIEQMDRDLLLEVYDKLNDGTMKLPIENDKFVIRELVDVSFAETTCVQPGHDHEEWLAKEATAVTMKVDLGVKQGTEILVLVYVNEEWIQAENVVNNGDGTITGDFEALCPVAFCVDADAEIIPPQTGDTGMMQLVLWGALLAGSLAAMVILLVKFKKSRA